MTTKLEKKYKKEKGKTIWQEMFSQDWEADTIWPMSGLPYIELLTKIDKEKATLFHDYYKKRIEEWGGAEFGKRMVQAWESFTTEVTQSKPAWLSTQQHAGAEEVRRAYAQVLAGRGDPRVGHILSLS